MMNPIKTQNLLFIGKYYSESSEANSPIDRIIAIISWIPGLIISSQSGTNDLLTIWD